MINISTTLLNILSNRNWMNDVGISIPVQIIVLAVFTVLLIIAKKMYDNKDK